MQLFGLGQRVGYYENKDGEIDFILRSPLNSDVSQAVAIEVKETPTSADLTSLQRRASRLDIQNTVVIGRQKSEKFSEYLWGGSI
jgi:hypothetical protein